MLCDERLSEVKWMREIELSGSGTGQGDRSPKIVRRKDEGAQKNANTVKMFRTIFKCYVIILL